jgi:DNA-binding MarR family transcriptional regulator
LADRRSSTYDTLDSLRRIVQALRESSRRAERDLGISGAQLFVLETLEASPGLSLNELAARTHTHQSSVSTVVARLVQQRLVKRRRSPRDARRLELVATDRGRRLRARAPDAVQRRLIRTIEGLPAGSQRTLARLLVEVVREFDGLDRRARAPRMFFDNHRGARRAARAPQVPRGRTDE